MRFDQAVWQRMSVPVRIGYTMAWIETRDPRRARSMKDVDVLMRRQDLARATAALGPHGFVFVEVNGVPMFLDGPDGKPSQAVHVVVADEPVSRHDRTVNPDLGPGCDDGQVPWPRVELERLLEMKLLAMRPHDIAHIGDLLRVGLIDRTWRDRVRPELRERFDRAYDEAERHYGGSAH